MQPVDFALPRVLAVPHHPVPRVLQHEHAGEGEPEGRGGGGRRAPEGFSEDVAVPPRGGGDAKEDEVVPDPHGFDADVDVGGRVDDGEIGVAERHL